MDFLQNHRVLSTVIAIFIAGAVVALLFFLSSSATDTRVTAVVEEYQGGANEDVEEAINPLVAEGQSIENTFFLDIDGDSSKEALVVVGGSGDTAPVDWYLLRLRPGTTEMIFERTMVAHGEVRVDGPRIVEREGLYAEGDDVCCPSEIKTTCYIWKDGHLIVSRVERSAAGI